MIPYAVCDRLSPAMPENVRLKGDIAKKMDEFLSNRVLSDFAKNTVCGEAEDAFRTRLDDETIVGIWRGEAWGKWVISASRVYRYTHDASLLAHLRSTAHALLATQREDGYIGTYKDSRNVFAPDPDETEKVVGWRSNWNWNVWCRKYTLWGLLEIYSVTGDEEILTGAEKFATQLIDELASLGTTLQATGTFNGLPSFSILKPMLILYRITEDKKYLDFCLDAANRWEAPDAGIPALIRNALSGRPVHTWYPKSEKWAKAYEMMSCVDGIIELYRVTGQEKYLTAAKNMHALLLKYEGNPVCSVGFNDIFANAAEWINGGTEPCDVIHWMRISSELFRLTGDVKYMNAFEAAFLNPFLAASLRGGTWGARVVKTGGCHNIAHMQSRMRYSHCCVNNMPRGYMNACESFIMASGSDVYINLYTPFTGSVSGVKVGISEGYLTDGRVTISVDSPSPVRVLLRVPEWSRETVITRGSDTFRPDANTCFPLDLAAGESTISVAFDMAPRLIPFAGQTSRFPADDFRVSRWIARPDRGDEGAMMWEKRSRLFYGPLLLTRSKFCGNTEEEMFASPAAPAGAPVSVTPVPSGDVAHAYIASIGGKEGRVCDFSSGSDLETDDNRLFNIWF